MSNTSPASWVTRTAKDGWSSSTCTNANVCSSATPTWSASTAPCRTIPGRSTGTSSRETDDDLPVSINGLTEYIVQGPAIPDVLAQLDATLGVDAATPNHVFYVVGGGGCCSDIEPAPPGRRSPIPGRNWKRSTSGRGVSVSVVDTGLLPDVVGDARHPWLHGVTGDREVYESGDIQHYVGHGTFIAGIVRCLAPEADVHMRLLPRGGAVYESKIVRQLNKALDRVPDIISLSAGTWTRNTHPCSASRFSGRPGCATSRAPCSSPRREMTRTGGRSGPPRFRGRCRSARWMRKAPRADYSNFGSWVDVYARGSDIVNAFPDGTYAYDEAPHKGQEYRFREGLAKWSGTSFATPIVAGLIAGRMSRTGESARDPADALKKLAIANAKPGIGPILRPGMASQS